jgi:conjugal transfer pilus assembly protein TraF
VRWALPVAIGLTHLCACPASAEQAEDNRQGYWWYRPAPAPADENPDEDALLKPSIPPMTELATWTPPKIRKLIEQQRDYAATVLTVEAVADF